MSANKEHETEKYKLLNELARAYKKIDFLKVEVKLLKKELSKFKKINQSEFITLTKNKVEKDRSNAYKYLA